MGPLLRIALGAGRLLKTAAVGRAPQPGGPTPITSSHPLAKYNKLIAVPVGAFLGWAATRTGWDWVLDYNEYITGAIIGYLVWRFPNALPGS